MAKKAEAWKEFKDAAMVEMMLEALPKVFFHYIVFLRQCKQNKTNFYQVAAEVAAPFASGLKDVKMISTGNGEVGAAKLTSEIMDIVIRVPEMVEKLTGVHLKVRQIFSFFERIEFSTQ